MVFDDKISLVIRIYDLPNDQNQDIELSWTVLPYFLLPFTGRNMVIKFNTDIDNLNDDQRPSFLTDSSGRGWIERIKNPRGDQEVIRGIIGWNGSRAGKETGS